MRSCRMGLEASRLFPVKAIYGVSTINRYAALLTYASIAQ